MKRVKAWAVVIEVAAVAHERERIALLWDGCEYDDVCGFVDIGAAIRRGE